MSEHHELLPEPTVTENSPLFEMREWRRELDKLHLEHANDERVLEAIAEARREVDAWIRRKAR
jgi:hypothetical protein